MSEKRILSVEHLNLSLRNGKKETDILRDVSFELFEGEKLGIVGTSGAGKSMTMYALTSLLPERTAKISGAIRYFDEGSAGTDILKMPKNERREYCSSHAAIILQDSINALNPYRKIGDQLKETAMLHQKMSGQIVEDYLCESIAQVGLEYSKTFAEHYPHQFSGGMRQRIAIAMALMSNAGILIADEPTTSLDAVNQMRFVELINQICADRNLAYIFISHNLGLVSMMCDHVAVMEQGRIIEQGSVENVFSKPEQEHTRSLVEGTKALFRNGE